MSQNVIPIVYHGGCYGIHALWLLATLTTDLPVLRPFAKHGTSHEINNILTANELAVRLIPGEIDKEIPANCRFVKFHPSSKNFPSVQENVRQLTDRFDKAIFVYPNRHHYLHAVSNFAYKIWDDLWSGPLNHIDVRDIYENFPEARGKNLLELPKYIVREFLSFNLFSSWEAMVEWYMPDLYQLDNVELIFFDDLFYRPERVLEHLKNVYNLKWTKNFDQVRDLHTEKIFLQRYFNKDSLCQEILDSLKHGRDFQWNTDQLTLVDESYLQKKLREQGQDLLCHGLNNFPSTTNELRLIIR